MSDEPRRGPAVFLALAAVLTLLHWTVLLLRLPVFASLPRWFWDFTDKPAGSLATLIVLVAAPVAVVATVLRTPGRHRLHLGLVFLLGLVLQFALALTEDRGIDALRDRMLHTGHAEFAEQAVRVETVARLVSDYEQLVASGDLGRYAPSKPPGQLLLYVATERLASLAAAPSGRGARLRRLRTFASYAWPVASLLVLFPLFRLGRLVADEVTAVRACLLYVFVPGFELVTLHTDQAFFPLLFTLPLATAGEAGGRGSFVIGAAAGVGASLAIFCSFGLLPVVPLSMVLASCLAVRGTTESGPTRLLRSLVGFLTGLLITHLVFRFALGYDALVRFRGAAAYHQAWKGGTSGFLADLGFAYVNAIEFAVWLGLPLAVLALSAVWSAVREWRRTGSEPAAVLALTVTAAGVILAVFGKTQGEVARLWLFLAPCLCLVAARELGRRFGPQNPRALALLLLLQGGTVYLVKRFMDFA